ncbi:MULTISPECIES: hypothetical protein [unclassified Roseofilum]|uniref:hypothetical protein n=1 Tax=unclassified Roseofilum TaxID=2620099 RepID=UPI001B2E3CB0|nr:MULTISPECIES: hypothetical protein [unclassified Roseofilum]MBP0010290.1 hypothetical protein [Roseofilum sp. Belize Diploria]MBP0015804.1 hypothetical protein [Roseofilum sp. SID3]MBP0023069.1 hypothetical protein [Roseofilum sp. SID2]MBP0034649.1 hypothetical protein [Roseofilum sp. Belize BBD 4]MBP0041251.1 hypothetical protein [Roseofilum sp. SBFL]
MNSISRISRIFLSSLLASGAMLYSPLSTLAQINQAEVNEILDSEEVFIEENPAQVEDQADFGQAVLTQEARAGLEFNNGAVGRLGSNSSVTVGQCVEVKNGQLLVSGPVDGCIAGFLVNVQGTLYLLEVDAENNGNIKVLEGTVLVTPQGALEAAEPIILSAGQKLPVVGNVLGQIQDITPEEFAQIVAGELFQGFTVPVTVEGALRSVCLQLFGDLGFTCTAQGIPVPAPPVSVPSVPGLPF